jgi:hypothetical protein
MLTLVFTLGLSGLAISAIYLAGGTQIVSKLYDRERDYRYAAEWALGIGKSRITVDTALTLPDTLYMQLMNAQSVLDASGTPVPKVKVDLYAGVGGSSTGQYGKFVELVAVAYDNGGARHVRRLQVQAENFARFAMFVDRWPGGCYTTGEIVRGRAHSNQGWSSCSSSPGPIYTDTVSAVNNVTGTAQYQSARVPSAPAIPFPSVAKLSWMPGYAASANLSLVAQPYAGTRGGTRMEFVGVDLDGDGQLTGQAEGYFRVFDGRTAVTAQFPTPPDTNEIRGSVPNNNNILALLANATWRRVIENQCGLNYSFNGRPGFVPIVAHDTLFPNQGGGNNKKFRWLIDSLDLSNGFTLANAQFRAHRGATDAGIVELLKLPGVRCYPAGDPHLMLYERLGTGYAGAVNMPNDTLHDNWKRGGEDTTFTAVSRSGSWRAWPGFGASFFTGATQRQVAEEPFLWPVHRMQNLNSKGVIYVNGDVWLSGVFRGRATLYISGTGKFVDDLTYVTNPASLPICQNLFGIITGDDLYITNNMINRPRDVDGTGAAARKFFDDNQDFFLHAVVLAGVSKTTAEFGVESYTTGANAGRLCTPVSPYSAQTSGGCINQAGGVIAREIAITFAGNYTGFAENRVKDACLDVDSPPYFPLTGRYVDNKFYEIDPAQFQAMGVANFYRRLQSGP